jgi:hypothetical protein
MHSTWKSDREVKNMKVVLVYKKVLPQHFSKWINKKLKKISEQPATRLRSIKSWVSFSVQWSITPWFFMVFVHTL